MESIVEILGVHMVNIGLTYWKQGYGQDEVCRKKKRVTNDSQIEEYNCNKG